MRALRRLDRGLAKIEEVALFVMLSALLALAVLQVGWRNILQPKFGKPPLLWVDEILKHLTFALGLLGASLAAHADKHISLDVLSKLLRRNPRWEVAIRILVRLAAIGICWLLFRAGWEQVQQKEEAIQVLVHPWQWQLAIPIAFALILVHFACRLAYDISILVQGQGPGQGRGPEPSTK